ncbi:MAG: DUF4190 domain-containing protein [Acidobacteriota bacterium]|nr:DUF4190 domain-containing protein [Acidobacteriota bacterium]
MKSCSICNQVYNDDNLNFCLNDGGVLIETGDDAPPTIKMNRVRTTEPNFSDYEPSAPWGSQPLQNQPFQNQPFPPPPNQSPYSMAVMPRGQNQVLPTVSLVLGILSIILFCCYGGFPFGLAALITGYLGYQNTNTDPQQYGGRGMAIAGMVTGAIGVLTLIMLIILGIAGSIFK